jgi:hypothetical protein
MDQLSNPALIDELEMSFKELSHSGRSRKAFHVYVSKSYSTFKALPLLDQERVRDTVIPPVRLEPLPADIKSINLADLNADADVDRCVDLTKSVVESFDSTDSVAEALQHK